jgi:hypothetical protein
MRKALPLIFVVFAVGLPVNAQTKAAEPYIVSADPSACEVNAAAFDNLVNILRSTGERLFVVARLGRGESSRELNRRRLYNVRTYFKLNWPNVAAERFVFAEGDRVEGEGRVEFYVGSNLTQASLVKRGGDICVDCCDYPDPTYYGVGKRDSPTDRGGRLDSKEHQRPPLFSSDYLTERFSFSAARTLQGKS